MDPRWARRCPDLNALPRASLLPCTITSTLSCQTWGDTPIHEYLTSLSRRGHNVEGFTSFYYVKRPCLMTRVERGRSCTPGRRLMVWRSMRGSDISRGPAAELPCPDVLSLMPCTALLYTVMPSGRGSPAQSPEHPKLA